MNVKLNELHVLVDGLLGRVLRRIRETRDVALVDGLVSCRNGKDEIGRAQHA